MTTLAHDSKANYRPDIDGLRAIAVLAVVIFHINASLLPGGFAGVDIFFVISGFLITGNIIKDARSSQGFLWGEFYRRRILRILPVLLVVLLVTLLVGQFVLLPSDLNKLSLSSLAAVFSAANIYFAYFLDTGYFADDSALQPLLHLWSLGVEEQFYLFWPIILVALLSRFSRVPLLLFTLLLAIASFALAEMLLASQPMFSYYMLPARAGELLIGALLAIWLRTGHVELAKWMRMLLGIVGMVLIVCSLVWVTEDMGFPGVNALPSTLGAAFIICAGSGGVTGVSRVLALRPMVLVGLISYSLYLWHWPVLAFYRYIYGAVGPLAGVGLFGVMLLLSVASYRWVEKPCRHLRWTFAQVTARFFVLSGAALSGLCGAILLTKGLGLYALDSDYQARLRGLVPAPAAFSYSYVCQRARLKEADLQKSDCVVNSDKEPDVLLWGDSNAAHYIGVLGAFAEASGFSFRNAAHSSCPPIFQGAQFLLKPDRVENCLASIEVVKKSLNRYSTVILGGAWSFYLGGGERFKKNLERTVEILTAQGKQVVILGQVPRMQGAGRLCRQKALKLPMLECGGDLDEAGKGVNPKVNKWLIELSGSFPNVHYFDVSDALCHRGRCKAYLNGSLLYFDAGHLSMEGSWALGRHILASKGLPKVFAELAVGQRIHKANAPLDEALLARGQAAFDLPGEAWSSLIGGTYGKHWRGSALQEGRLEQGGVLQDDRDDAYNLVRYRIPDAEVKAFTKEGGYIHFRVKISTCAENFPLLRLLARAGGREVKYDVALDCAAGRVLAKGAFRSKDVEVESKDGGLMLKARYQIQPDLNGLEIVFFPASGNSLGAYSSTAVGTVAIDDIELAFVSAGRGVSGFTAGASEEREVH